MLYKKTLLSGKDDELENTPVTRGLMDNRVATFHAEEESTEDGMPHTMFFSPAQAKRVTNRRSHQLGTHSRTNQSTKNHILLVVF